jgi:cell division protein FtsN
MELLSNNPFMLVTFIISVVACILALVSLIYIHKIWKTLRPAKTVVKPSDKKAQEWSRVMANTRNANEPDNKAAAQQPVPGNRQQKRQQERLKKKQQAQQQKQQKQQQKLQATETQSQQSKQQPQAPTPEPKPAPAAPLPAAPVTKPIDAVATVDNAQVPQPKKPNRRRHYNRKRPNDVTNGN